MKTKRHLLDRDIVLNAPTAGFSARRMKYLAAGIAATLIIVFAPRMIGLCAPWNADALKQAVEQGDTAKVGVLLKLSTNPNVDYGFGNINWVRLL